MHLGINALNPEVFNLDTLAACNSPRGVSSDFHQSSNEMTTKETIDNLWREGLSGSADLKDKDKSPYHEFSAGTFQDFECAAECIEVSFRRGNEVIARKRPPGHMRSVPGDVTIVVNGGNDGGRAKVW